MDNKWKLDTLNLKNKYLLFYQISGRKQSFSLKLINFVCSNSNDKCVFGYNMIKINLANRQVILSTRQKMGISFKFLN